MRQRGFINFLVLLGAALFLFGGIGYYAYKNGQIRINSQETMPTSTPTTFIRPTLVPYKTGKLETYTNTNYKYSIDYYESDRPPSLLTEKTGDGYKSGYEQVATSWGCIIISSAFSEAKKVPNYYSGAGHTLPWNLLDQLLTLENGSSLLIHQKKWTDDFTIKIYYKRMPDTSLANATWTRWQETNNFENHGLLESMYTKRADKEYWLKILKGGADTACNPAYVDKILSTFKFTN